MMLLLCSYPALSLTNPPLNTHACACACACVCLPFFPSAHDLNLSGFSVIGKPGLVCIEGGARQVTEFNQRLRRLPWQKMQTKVCQKAKKKRQWWNSGLCMLTHAHTPQHNTIHNKQAHKHTGIPSLTQKAN